VPKANRSIMINRPIAEVFTFFADAENDPRWRSGVREIKRQGELGAGTRYHQRVNGPAGRAITADIEVTAYEPDRHVAFRATAGPVRPHDDGCRGRGPRPRQGRSGVPPLSGDES